MLSVRCIALVLLVAGCDVVFGIEPPVDAAAFDAARDCPTGYDLAFTSGSRYRISTTPQFVWEHSMQCDADLPGATHLAVIDQPDEAAALQAALESRQAYRWYVGAVQRPASTPETDWLWVNGSPFDPGGWAASEPNDDDGIESSGEQFAVIQEDRGLSDFRGTESHQALCECDGRGVTPDARAALDVARP